MYIAVYSTLNEGKDGELLIEGPFFYAIGTKNECEIHATELSDNNTKGYTIPWVKKMQDNESVGDAMERIRDGWFSKFRKRTRMTHQTITRDQELNTCPFQSINAKEIIEELVNDSQLAI